MTAVAALSLPDGRYLLATGANDRSVRLWDPVTQACMQRISLFSPCRALCELRAGHLAVGLADGIIVLYVTDRIVPAPPDPAGRGSRATGMLLRPRFRR